MPKYTPMMEQYLEIKQQYPYSLVFFRLGDFYELFFDDALLASKELNLVLTGRDCGQEERAPMCGVPHHSADGYIARLVEKGYKVAICEQTEDPKATKTIVRREVVRVVTPGTVQDPGVLDTDKNNYIAAVYEEKNGFGLSVADITTGDFYTMTIAHGTDKLINALSGFSPAEIISGQTLTCAKKLEDTFKIKISQREDYSFNYPTAHKNLCTHFKTLNLSCFGIEDNKPAVCASGALLSYLQETQKNSLAHLSAVKLITDSSHMALDAASRRNLEICETMRDKHKKGSLLWALDKTKTAMGARTLRKWLTEPLQDINEINARLDAVDEFKSGAFLREETRSRLSGTPDTERLLSRVVYGIANARDLTALKHSVKPVPDIKALLYSCTAPLNKYFYEEMDDLSDIFAMIDEAIMDNPPPGLKDGGFIKDGYDSELDKYREAITQGAQWILELESKELVSTGIKNLKIKYNKIFGYFFEVSKSNQKLVPERFIRTQTLANSERYATPELKQIEETILGAEDKMSDLELRLFSDLRSRLTNEVSRIQATANMLASIDTLQALAEAADTNGYVRPKINQTGRIEIRDGRHPVIELTSDSAFVPNDTLIDKDNERMMILTGPNMAGKSTYMRQVALITLMAHAGSFVPAKYADISITDKIFTRVGASDDLATGQSTFMVEMNEVSNILNNATPDSLIILDEIGRGTSTYDGLAIAWAVLEYIADTHGVGAKTLFATHYHEITELESKIPGVVNYSVMCKESGDDIIFLRKISRGGADKSYGIQVARLAGLPDVVISRANQILSALNEADITRAKTDSSIQAHYKNYKKSSGIIINDLLNADIDKLSPREALKKIIEWKALSKSDS